MLIGLDGRQLKSAPKATPTTGQVFDRALKRDPDPAWLEQLERITAPSERVSRLIIRWHPGTLRRSSPFRASKWIPVERWIIYQQLPIQATPPVLRMPYTQTFSRRVRAVTRGVDMIRGLVDRVQWELYLETGCYCQPFWVVQGPNGGHRRNYDRQEEQIAQLLKLPQAPPDLGALPYAEPSPLTFERLYQMDELRRYKKCLAFDQRRAEELDAEEKEGRIGMRMAILKTMDQNAYEAVSGNMGVWRDALAQVELPSKVDPSRIRPIDYEAAERDFVMFDN